MICKEALDIIKESETLQLKAYICPAGILTIGYGHTGPDVKPGMVITKEQAETLLQQDLERFERDVRNLVKVHVNENQFGALVSFAFNVGSDIDDDELAEGLGDSTLLKKLNKYDYAGAANEFGKWVHANGKKLNGLVTRREREKQLFLKPVWHTVT